MTILALLAIIALSVFFTSLRGVNSGAAPLLSLACIMVALSVAGVLGILLPVGVAIYVASAGLCAFAIVKRGGKALLKRMLSPGFLFFCAMAVIMLCWLFVRQPIFAEWDEYSFWGSAAKRISETNAMYVNTEAGGISPWPATGQPALIMLSYFAQLFGQFAPWKTYWAYDILLFACAGATVAAFNLRRIRAWVPVIVCALLLPFAFGLWYSTITLTPVWLSAYGDLPAGLLFGAAIAFYYMLRHNSGEYSVLLIPAEGGDKPLKIGSTDMRCGNTHKNGGMVCLSAIPLTAFALCKDNLFTLALLAAGLMAADSLFFGKGWHKSDTGRVKLKTLEPNKRLYKVGGWALKIVGWFAVVLGANFMWQRYAAHAINGLAPTNVSTGVSIVQAMREIFGLVPRGQEFYNILNEMIGQFFGGGIVNMSIFGSGLVTMLVIVAVFVLAVVLAQSKRQRLRNAMCGGIMFIGFWLYQFGLFVVYAYFLKPSPGQERAVKDYGRYLGSYLIGWLLVGIVLLALCFAENCRDGRPRSSARYQQRRIRTTEGGRPYGAMQALQKLAPIAARLAVLVLALFMAVRVWVLARPGYTVLDYSDELYIKQVEMQASAQSIKNKLAGGEHLFFVCQSGDSAEWYRYAYCLMPQVVLDVSVTAGSEITPAELPLEDEILQNGTVKTGLKTVLAERECDGILIVDLDEGFISSYGEIFAGGLTDWAGTPALYMMNDEGLFELLA